MLESFTIQRARNVVWEDDKVLCDGVEYELRFQNGSSEGHFIGSKCVFSLEQFARLNSRSDVVWYQVLQLIQALYYKDRCDGYDTALAEAECLWSFIDLEGLSDDELVKLYGRCLRIQNGDFLKHALAKIVCSSGWKHIDWRSLDLDDLFLYMDEMVAAGFDCVFDLVKELVKKGVVDRRAIVSHILQYILNRELTGDRECFSAFLSCATANDVAGIIQDIGKELINKLDEDELFCFLKKCTPSVRNRRYVFAEFCSKASASGDNVDLVARYIKEFKPDIHEEDNRAIRWSLQLGGLEIVKLLARNGADISLSLSHVKSWRNVPKNAAVDYAEEVEALHKILKKRKSLKVSKYKLYYNTPACILVANKLNANFKLIHAAYEASQKQNNRRRL